MPTATVMISCGGKVRPLALKFFKRLLHDRKGDANLQGFRLTRWTFKSRNALGEPVFRAHWCRR